MDACECLCVRVQGVSACMCLWSSTSWCIRCICVYPACDRVSVSFCCLTMSMWTAVCEGLCALCMSGVFEHVCALCFSGYAYVWMCMHVPCFSMDLGSIHVCEHACALEVCEHVCPVSMPLCLGDIRSWMTQYPVSVYRCHACAHTSVYRPLCLCPPHVCLPTETHVRMYASQGAWGWAV